MTVRITVDLPPRFSGWVERRADIAARAVQAGVAAAAQGAKLDLRQRVAAALGQRAGNMIGAKVYPPGSGGSLQAAAVLYPRGPSAANILDVFGRGVTIRAASGLWLAVPTDAIPKHGPLGKRITTRDVEQIYGRRLRFVYRSGKPGLLVLDGVRMDSRGRARSLTGRRKGVAYSRTTGRATIIAFVLVPAVRIRKVYAPEAVVRTWAARIPTLIDRALPADPE